MTTGRQTSIKDQLYLHGLDETLRQAQQEATTPRQRAIAERRVEKTFEMVSELAGAGDFAFLHTAMCQTFLPHSRPKNNYDVWIRHAGKLTLMVQPGVMNQEARDTGSETKTSMGSSPYVGVPYGPKARLILIYLQSEGLKSRTVSLGESMSAFMRSLGLAVTGGQRGTINAVKEQTLRLTRCNFILQFSNSKDGNDYTQVTDARITDGVEFWKSSSGEWSGVVELNEKFHENLKLHAMALDKRAIAHLAGNSLSLDLYTFFAYRLPQLSKSLDLSWSQLQGQVGAEVSSHRLLGQRIREVLPEVRSVYPGAQVDVREGGLRLWPSPSSVPRTCVQGFKLLDANGN